MAAHPHIEWTSRGGLGSLATRRLKHAFFRLPFTVCPQIYWGFRPPSTWSGRGYPGI